MLCCLLDSAHEKQRALPIFLDVSSSQLYERPYRKNPAALWIDQSYAFFRSHSLSDVVQRTPYGLSSTLGCLTANDRWIERGWGRAREAVAQG